MMTKEDRRRYDSNTVLSLADTLEDLLERIRRHLEEEEMKDDE